MKTKMQRLAIVLATVMTLQGVVPNTISYARACPSQEVGSLSLPDGKIGQSYDYQLQTEGGLPPFMWKVVGGELPPGLSLDPSGKLRGIPTAPRREAYSFIVEVSDASQRAALPCLLIVQPAPLRVATVPSTLRIVPRVPSSAANREGRPTEAATFSIASTVPRITAPPATENLQPTERIDWPYVAPPRIQASVIDNAPPAGRMRYATIAKPRPTESDVPADENPPRAENLDPAKFVRIYEAPKTRHLINENYGKLIYDPADKKNHLKSTKLDADESSTLIIVPQFKMMDEDMPLNNLFINAELTSGDQKTPLEVIGYSEIGKAQNAALGQQGMAFQSTKNIIAMMLNLAYTSDDLYTNVLKDSAKTPEEVLQDMQSDAKKWKKGLDRLRLLRPEITAIAEFMQRRQNLNIVEIVGTEVFWIDRASMQAIAKQYEDNLKIAFDGGSTDDAKRDAVADMLRRTLLVIEDLQDPMTEVKLMQSDYSKYKALGLERKLSSGRLSEEVKDRITQLQTIQARRDTLDPNGNDETKKSRKALDDLAKAIAIQIFAEEWGGKALAKLGKLFTPGYISLDSARAKDGDRLTIRVEARSSDVEGPGIPALFEVTVKRFGAKIHLGSSFMFIRRLGLEDKDVKPPDGSAGLKQINFAPSPGATLGVTYFARGDSAGAKFFRGLAPTFGMNVAFMNFNDPGFDLSTGKFTNTTGTTVQVGAGPLLSLFNNKLHFTYGWNLNAEQKRNYFGVGFGFLEVADFLKNKLKGSDAAKQ